MIDSPRPVIAVCTPLERARWGFWDAEAAVTSSTYLSAVGGADGLCVLVPPTRTTAAGVDALLDRVDGVLLIGGSDLDPSTYGAVRQPDTEQPYPLRDHCELAMATRALERDIPVLGICRGMQLLNVARGGTLIQHLDAAQRAVHRRALGTFVGTDHIVNLAPGSALEAAVGERAHRVHCHHHQAVDRVGADFQVVATADDGIVEAIESVAHTYAVGVQWHPEADETSRVIGSLVDAARRSAQALHGRFN